MEAMEPAVTGSAAARTAPRGAARAAVLAAVRAPLSQRARRELGYLAAGVPLGIAGFFAVLLLALPGLVLCTSLLGVIAGLALLTAATAAGRGLSSVQRRLAGALIGETWPRPAPFVPARGLLRRVDARLRDRPGWRGVGYVLLRLPLALLSVYAVAAFWVAGLFYLTYPAWWAIAQTTGSAASRSPVVTLLPAGGLRVTSWPGAFVVPLLGLALLLAAPWAVRLIVTADRWLMRWLLASSGLPERVRALEASRARAVDDSAATLRRVERDLHDGAQARLVALAMQLGQAQEKLAPGADPGSLDRARDLVGAAHRSAKEALTELRDLARGIHPPALDQGLPEALATLAARSAVPATLTADVPVRPTAAIETIGYFCAAELLANVAKHSAARQAAILVAAHGGMLRLSVTDDGVGGAAPRPGSGLAGLTQRVAVVDGSLTVDSPDGGPTAVTVELPLKA
jgi:signal transduction histidine kinase